MPVILAVDPGLSGAMAVLDAKRGSLDIYDMPTTMGKVRKVINELELYTLISMLADSGVETAWIEQVGGMPGQSAPAAFNFGFGVGLVKMALVSKGVPIEMVPASVWKAFMHVNKDKSSAIQRANELVPSHARYWAEGAPGEKKLKEGRAEAVLMALYAERKMNGAYASKASMWVQGKKS